MTTRSVWAARVEVLAGMAAFALALLTWAVWLLVPLYEQHDGCTRLACPLVTHLSLVDASGGPGNFVHFNSGLSLLILAFLVVTGLVAGGAYLHGGRQVAIGRHLVWGGSFVLPLLISCLLAVMSVLGRLMAAPAVGPYTLVLGVGAGLCAGLALIASVAAASAAGGGRTEQGRPPVARAGQSAQVEVLAGVAAFVLSLLTWAVWLFAPLHKVSFCDRLGCPHTVSLSLVGAAGDLDAVVRLLPSIALLILVFLILTGLVAVGAYLHGTWRLRAGRVQVWGGSLLLPLVVSALAALPLASVLPIGPIPPNLQALGDQLMMPGPDALILALGPGLCAGLALIASVAAMKAERARHWAAQ